MSHALAAEAPQYNITSDQRRFEYLPVATLVVDPNKQREIRNNHKTETMATNWDWDKAEAATVHPTDESEQTFDVIEGQHRIVALKTAIDQGLASPDLTFPCFIIDGLSRAQQAKLGVEIPRSRSVHTALDKWKQDVRAQRPHQVMVERVLAEHGIAMAVTPSTVGLTCPGAINRMITRYDATTAAEHFDDTITVLETAYRRDSLSAVARWNKQLLQVVFGLIVTNENGIDLDRLAAKLSLMPAESWVELGRGPRGGGVPTIREELVKRYNLNLRKGRI